MNERGRLVRLPMKYVEGQWVLEYGGDLAVEHGAMGDLPVETRLVGETPEKDLFTREEQTAEPVTCEPSSSWLTMERLVSG